MGAGALAIPLYFLYSGSGNKVLSLEGATAAGPSPWSVIRERNDLTRIIFLSSSLPSVQRYTPLNLLLYSFPGLRDQETLLHIPDNPGKLLHGKCHSQDIGRDTGTG
jgi:hypothetical protein